LLRSANDKHPKGLANGSDQVGRNYMRHNQSILMALMREPNDTVFQKTLAVSDYYFGSDDWDFPLGLIQMCATSHGAQIRGEALPSWLEWVPKMPFEEMARHSMDFWLSSEDLPRPENRIFYDGDRVVLDITEGNMEAHHRLKKKLGADAEQSRRASGCWSEACISARIPIGGTAHQAGTARFGTDPATSVLDLDCKAHELDNLYLADASFFPSIGAVNPTLTIIANALRVADKIKIGMKPFVELSFMPSALSSGDQTVFHYRPMSAAQGLCAMGRADQNLVRHWVERYGLGEVRQWFFEVWNEPNLTAFGSGKQSDYFELYRYTVEAIKGVDKIAEGRRPRNGRQRLDRRFSQVLQDQRPCRRISSARIIIRRIPSASRATTPMTELADSTRSILREETREVRKKAGDLPVYYTEWCTSSNPRDPMHDDPYAAAFIVKTVLEANGGWFRDTAIGPSRIFSRKTISLRCRSKAASGC
jgi:hypothetical protein